MKDFAINTEIGQLAGYNYEVAEPKAVMVVIHGIGEHMGRYKRMARILAEDGIALVGMDLRGHGKSPGKRGDCCPRTGILSDIDLLLEWTRENYRDLPLVFYGHSMGGGIALDYRSRGGLNHLPCAYIISAPWVELVRAIPGPLYGIVKAASKVAPHLTMGSAVNEADLGHPNSVLPYLEDPLVHNKISLGAAIDGFEIGRALAAGTHEDNGRGKAVPCLVMHGMEDKICSIEGARKVASLETSPDFQYIEWPGHYHEIHNGGPDNEGDDVIEKIAEFVKEKAGI